MNQRKNIVWLLLAVACIGFLDASYLTIEHYRGVVPPCTVSLGCEAVTTSGYATLMRVPVALLGSIYYLGMICLLGAYLRKGNEHLLRHFRYLSIVGLIASAYFVYLQVAVIGAICQYCMVSAGTSTTLFLLSWLGLRDRQALQINNN